MKTQKHECPALKEAHESLGVSWTLENRGDGWYMYDQYGQRSTCQYEFCTSCGEKLKT